MSEANQIIKASYCWSLSFSNGNTTFKYFFLSYELLLSLPLHSGKSVEEIVTVIHGRSFFLAYLYYNQGVKDPSCPYCSTTSRTFS